MLPTAGEVIGTHHDGGDETRQSGAHPIACQAPEVAQEDAKADAAHNTVGYADDKAVACVAHALANGVGAVHAGHAQHPHHGDLQIHGCNGNDLRIRGEQAKDPFREQQIHNGQHSPGGHADAGAGPHTLLHAADLPGAEALGHHGGAGGRNCAGADIGHGVQLAADAVSRRGGHAVVIDAGVDVHHGAGYHQALGDIGDAQLGHGFQAAHVQLEAAELEVEAK